MESDMKNAIPVAAEPLSSEERDYLAMLSENGRSYLQQTGSDYFYILQQTGPDYFYISRAVTIPVTVARRLIPHLRDAGRGKWVSRG